MLRMGGGLGDDKPRPDGIPFETFRSNTKIYNEEGIQLIHSRGHYGR